MNYYLNESTTGFNYFYRQKQAHNNPFNGFDVGAASVPVFTDVNGDNKTDMVVGETTGTLKFYLNESTTDTITFTEKTGEDNPSYG